MLGRPKRVPIIYQSTVLPPALCIHLECYCRFCDEVDCSSVMSLINDTPSVQNVRRIGFSIVLLYI